MTDMIFISYSREDEAYVKRLHACLTEHGLNCWYDFNILRGDSFPQVLAERIKACAALVLIMTPAAEASKWVNNEVKYAQDHQKPVLPLLLRGKPLISVTTLDYEDVRGERMPGVVLIERLKTLTGPGVPMTPMPVPAPTPPTLAPGPAPRSGHHFAQGPSALTPSGPSISGTLSDPGGSSTPSTMISPAPRDSTTQQAFDYSAHLATDDAHSRSEPLLYSDLPDLDAPPAYRWGPSDPRRDPGDDPDEDSEVMRAPNAELILWAMLAATVLLCVGLLWLANNALPAWQELW